MKGAPGPARPSHLFGNFGKGRHCHPGGSRNKSTSRGVKNGGVMRSSFIAVLVAPFVLTGAAQAADLQRPVYKAPAVAAAYSWSGFYIGLHAGYGWGEEKTGRRPFHPAASRSIVRRIHSILTVSWAAHRSA